MGGGSQDTKSETVNKPPKWFNDAAIKSLEVADQINQAGYVPYMGNQVAAFTPTQQAAMQSVNDWAAAAGGGPAVDAMAGMPQATVDGSGVAGYESATGMMRNLDLLRQRFPKQYSQLSKFGGDLLSDPSRPPSDIANSPWGVGATAKKSWDSQNAGGGGMGRYSFEQLIQQGLTDGGPMGGVMAFMGRPYLSRGGNDSAPHGSGPAPMQRMSAFNSLAQQDMLYGRNPWAKPQKQQPQIEQPPLPTYNSPAKWW